MFAEYLIPIFAVTTVFQCTILWFASKRATFETAQTMSGLVPDASHIRLPTDTQYWNLYVYFIFLRSWESAVLDTVFFDIETAVGFTSLYRSDPSLLLVAVTFSLYIHIYTYITDHSKIRQPGRLMWPNSFISLCIQMYY